MAINENSQAAANVQQGGVTDYAKNPLQQKAKVRFEPQEEAPVAVEETKPMQEKAPVSVEDIQAEPVQMASLPDANVMTDADPSAVLPQQTEQQPVQTAGRFNEIIPLMIDIFGKPKKSIEQQVKKREEKGDTLIRSKAFDSPNLVQENFDPERFLDELNTISDPKVGGEKTRFDKPLSSDRGINFEHFAFEGGSDAFEAIEIVAQTLPDKLVVKNSTTLNQARKSLAQDLNILPDMLEGNLNLSAKNITAARILLGASASKMRDYAKLAEKGDKEQLLLFRRQLVIHRGLVLAVRNLRAEAGRTLQAAQIVVKDKDIDSVEELLDRFGGVHQTEKMVKHFLELDKTDPSAASRYAADVANVVGRSLDKLHESMVNGMISLPTTTAKVILGNAQHFLMAPLDDAAAAVIAKRKLATGKIFPDGGDATQAELSDPLVRMLGWTASFGDGLRMAKKSFLSDQPVDAYGRLDDAKPPAWSREQYSASFRATPGGKLYTDAVHYLGHVMRFNTRLMTTADAFTKTLVARGELNVAVNQHMQNLRRTGEYTDEEILDDALRMFLDPRLSELGADGDALIKRLQGATGSATLTAPIGRTLANIGQPWRMGDPTKIKTKIATLAGSAFNTFWRVSVNSYRETYRRSPFAPLLPSFWREIKAGGHRRDKALGQMAAGALIMHEFFKAGVDGTCTGAGVGQRTYDYKKMGFKENRPPFSCRVGFEKNPDGSQGKEIWYSYAGLEPLGGLIAAGVTVGEAYRYGDATDKEWENAISALAMLPFRYMAELPFTEGLSSVAGIITTLNDTDADADDTIKSFNRAAKRLVDIPASAIPMSAWRRAFTKSDDEYKRMTQSDPTKDSPDAVDPLAASYIGAVRRLYAQTPGLSDSLPYVRSATGRIMKHDASKATDRFYFPFRRTINDKSNPFEAEHFYLTQANDQMPFAYPKMKVAGVNLTPKQFDDWLATIYSTDVERKLNNFVRSTKYKDLINKGATLKAAAEMAVIYNDAKYEATKRLFGWDSKSKKLINRNSTYPNVGEFIERKHYEERIKGRKFR